MSEQTSELTYTLSSRLDWEEIYHTSLPRVYNFFLYRAGDRSLAEDLTSETFERAWRRRAWFNLRRGSPLVWLLGIARNVWREHLRSNRHEAEELNEALPSPERVEEIYQEDDLKHRLRLLLRTLPEREAELIALKYGSELTNRQIARLSGLSESNVGTILHRTVTLLKQRLEEHDGR